MVMLGKTLQLFPMDGCLYDDCSLSNCWKYIVRMVVIYLKQIEVQVVICVTAKIFTVTKQYR